MLKEQDLKKKLTKEQYPKMLTKYRIERILNVFILYLDYGY